MLLWRCGALALLTVTLWCWQCDRVAFDTLRQYGAVAVSCCGGVVLWRCHVVAESCCGSVVAWWSRAVITVWRCS